MKFFYFLFFKFLSEGLASLCAQPTDCSVPPDDWIICEITSVLHSRGPTERERRGEMFGMPMYKVVKSQLTRVKNSGSRFRLLNKNRTHEN